MVNYTSPYSEYFKEIADFTQNTIDYFYEKKRRKKSLSCSEISQIVAEVAEENENENLSQSPKHIIGNYQIFINNINYQGKEEEQIADTINYRKTDARRFAFLDKIYHKKNLKNFINNLNYKEIKKEKINSFEQISRSNIAKIEKKKSSNFELKSTGSLKNL